MFDCCFSNILNLLIFLNYALFVVEGFFQTSNDDGRTIMPPLDDNSTLGEAKAWLQAGVRKGVICPCCTQYAKIYVRPLNSSMARDLIWLVRTYDAMGTWVDVSLAPKSFHMSREFAKLRYWDLIEELRRAGLTFEEPRTQTGDSLQGMTVVITGTLPTLSREQAASLVEASGGRVANSVSKKTTFVVVGADAGSKLEKARTLGVETIDEAEFLRRTRG